MREVTADKLRRVATVYTFAAGEMRPPTQAVAEALRVSRSAAAKLVSRARQSGLLPPTTMGAATRPQHSPTMAVIHLHSAAERRWRVCRECLIPWPCPSWRHSESRRVS